MKTALAAALLLLALPASVAEPPVPQLFRGMSGEQGQWRMEILEMQGRDHAMQGGMPAMTLCTDNLFREARARSQRRGRSDCKHRLLKDTPDEMLMESECPDGTSRILMQREGAKRLLMQGEVKDRRGTSTMKMRYTYEGACQGGAPAMRFDKDSQACRQMRAQLAQMDPDKSCASAGAQRAACEARLRAAAEQMAAMCR
jgi:hypothetical protein